MVFKDHKILNWANVFVIFLELKFDLYRDNAKMKYKPKILNLNILICIEVKN